MAPNFDVDKLLHTAQDLGLHLNQSLASGKLRYEPSNIPKNPRNIQDGFLYQVTLKLQFWRDQVLTVSGRSETIEGAHKTALIELQDALIAVRQFVNDVTKQGQQDQQSQQGQQSQQD